MRLGEKLYNLGLRSTAWHDINTGQLTSGIFNPSHSHTDPINRYGNPLGLRLKIWPNSQYTGAHSVGPNARAYEFMYWVWDDDGDKGRVETFPEWSQEFKNDVTDLCFIQKASETIMKMALERGLIDESEPSKPVTNPKIDPKPDSGADPDILAKLKDLEEKGVRLVLSLAAIKSKVIEMSASLPVEGGGRWVSALRKLCDSILLETKKSRD